MAGSLTLPTIPIRGHTNHCCSCCGPLMYLRDECDGAEVFKCHWNNTYWRNNSTDNWNRDFSNWTCDGNKYIAYKGRRVPDLTGLDYADFLCVPVRNIPPPWTWEGEVRTTTPSLGISSGSDVYNTRLRFARKNGSGIKIESNSGANSSSYTILWDGGVTTPTFNTITTNRSFTTDTHIYYIKMSLDVAGELVFTVEIDGSVPTIVSGSSLPFSGDLTNQTTFNNWCLDDFFRWEIMGINGLDIHYMEMRMRTGIH